MKLATSLRHSRFAPLALLAALVVGPMTLATQLAVSGAGFTSVNETVDGTGHCQNGNPNNNCNIYYGKQYVWLNGGPSANGLTPGVYYFAIQIPAGNNYNDGDSGNLSDAPNGDSYTNRIFIVGADGEISTYNGTHDKSTFSGTAGKGKNKHTINYLKIRAFYFDDTTNPGGEYKMAICRIGDDLQNITYPVGDDQCKFDNFKVKLPTTTTLQQTTTTTQPTTTTTLQQTTTTTQPTTTTSTTIQQATTTTTQPTTTTTQPTTTTTQPTTTSTTILGETTTTAEETTTTQPSTTTTSVLGSTLLATTTTTAPGATTTTVTNKVLASTLARTGGDTRPLLIAGLLLLGSGLMLLGRVRLARLVRRS